MAGLEGAMGSRCGQRAATWEAEDPLSSYKAQGVLKQGNQSLSRELRASALCPGLEAQFPARRRDETGCGPVTGKDRASCCTMPLLRMCLF